MKVVIMGCGRLGASLAGRLDNESHGVTVIDPNSNQFQRLPSGFEGRSLVGSGTDHRTLLEAGIEQADAFLALAHGDNRNILASQIAKHLFGVETVVSRIYDPFRAELFQRLGLRTFSPTNIGADLAYNALSDQELIGD